MCLAAGTWNANTGKFVVPPTPKTWADAQSVAEEGMVTAKENLGNSIRWVGKSASKVTASWRGGKPGGVVSSNVTVNPLGELGGSGEGGEGLGGHPSSPTTEEGGGHQGVGVVGGEEDTVNSTDV